MRHKVGMIGFQRVFGRINRIGRNPYSPQFSIPANSALGFDVGEIAPRQ